MIYANISSEDSGKLVQSLESIYNQVDEINVYTTTPTIKDTKINYHVAKEPNSNGKFFFLDKVDGFYFTFNDDIIYPPNYVKETLPRFITYDIISYGGKNFRSFPLRQYETSSRDIYSPFIELPKDKYVQFPFTGAMAFHVNDLKITYKDFDKPNMDEVIVGCLIKQTNKRTSCLKHPTNWLIHNGKYTGEIERRKTLYVNENFKEK